MQVLTKGMYLREQELRSNNLQMISMLLTLQYSM